MKLEIVLLIAVVVILDRRHRGRAGAAGLSESYALLSIGVAVVGSLLALARPLVDRLSNAIGIVYGTEPRVRRSAILFLLIVCINLVDAREPPRTAGETLAQELALRDVQGGESHARRSVGDPADGPSSSAGSCGIRRGSRPRSSERAEPATSAGRSASTASPRRWR